MKKEPEGEGLRDPAGVDNSRSSNIDLEEAMMYTHQSMYYEEHQLQPFSLVWRKSRQFMGLQLMMVGPDLRANMMTLHELVPLVPKYVLDPLYYFC